MNWISLGVGVIVVLSLARPGQAGFGGKSCWPGNETKAQCFSILPKSELVMPSESRDSYVADDMQVMDVEDYSVVTMQKSPRDFCLYKDKMVQVMECLTDAMAAKCPDLPSEVLSKAQRFQQAIDGFCRQIDNIDPACMMEHWQASMDCHRKLMDPAMPRPPKSGSGSGSGSGAPKWGGHSEDHSEDQDNVMGDGSRPAMDDDMKQQQHEAWNAMICRWKYKMEGCVEEQVRECDETTAVVMSQFMRDMASADCAAKMEAWDAEAAGGATSVSVGAKVIVVVLSPLILLLLLRRVGF